MRKTFAVLVTVLTVFSCNSNDAVIPEVKPDKPESKAEVKYPSFDDWNSKNDVYLDPSFLAPGMNWNDTVDLSRTIVTDKNRRFWYWGFKIFKENSLLYTYDLLYELKVCRFYPTLVNGCGKAKGENFEYEILDSVITHMDLLDGAFELNLVRSTQDSLYYNFELRRKEEGRAILLYIYETIGKEAERRTICVMNHI